MNNEKKPPAFSGLGFLDNLCVPVTKFDNDSATQSSIVSKGAMAVAGNIVVSRPPNTREQVKQRAKSPTTYKRVVIISKTRNETVRKINLPTDLDVPLYVVEDSNCLQTGETAQLGPIVISITDASQPTAYLSSSESNSRAELQHFHDATDLHKFIVTPKSTSQVLYTEFPQTPLSRDVNVVTTAVPMVANNYLKPTVIVDVSKKAACTVNVSAQTSTTLAGMCNIVLDDAECRPTDMNPSSVNSSRREIEPQNSETPIYYITCPALDEPTADQGPSVGNQDGIREVNIDILCRRPRKPLSTMPEKEAHLELLDCLKCDFTTLGRQSMADHVKGHQVLKPHQCMLCQKTFSKPSALKYHMERHSNVRRHKCGLCTFEAYAKMDLQRHVRLHTNSKQYICQYCGKMFKLDNSLRTHIRTKHEVGYTYRCDQCDFSTVHRSNMKVHFGTQHGNISVNYKCLVCGVYKNRKTSYILHMQSHAGDKPFSCEQCQRRYTSASTLRTHCQSVHGPRSHACHVCDKTFQTAHHRDRHLMTHSLERPFPCPLCDYCCNSKGNLAKHVKGSHGVVNFSQRAKKAVVNVTPTLAEACLQKGKGVTDQYLQDLSAKSGHNVTVEELKLRLQQQAKKPMKLPPRKVEKADPAKRMEHAYAYMTSDDGTALACTDELELDLDSAGNQPCANSGSMSQSNSPMDGLMFNAAETGLYEEVVRVNGTELPALYDESSEGMYIEYQDQDFQGCEEEILLSSSLLIEQDIVE